MLQASILHSGKLLGFLAGKLSREALSFESFVERHAKNAGHFPQVRVQVTMLQINSTKSVSYSHNLFRKWSLRSGETVNLIDL